jgi:hypothetical protein
MMATAMTWDVFISYAQRDAAMADRLRAMLEDSGLTCWIAPRDIVPGVTWADAIVEALAQSKVMILVFSQNANESRQLARELDQADRERVPVVPLRIQNVEPAGGMEYYLGNTHWLDAYVGSLDDHRERILQAVRTLIRRRSASMPSEGTAVEPKLAQQRLAKPPVTGLSRMKFRALAAGVLVSVLGAGLYPILISDSAERPTESPQPEAIQPPNPGRPSGGETTGGVLNLRGRSRPVQPGYSVGIATGGAGTICCFVTESEGNAVYVLSADHVFSGEPGTPVIQPSRFDGGGPADRIATITKKAPLSSNAPNLAAGAIAKLDPGVGYSQFVPGVGPIRGVADSVRPGELLRAVSRTSQFAAANVIAVNASVPIVLDASNTPVRFEALIETTRFSMGGDSGSPVFNAENKLVGMVFAGSDESSFVMPITPVLKALGVKLVQSEP